MVCDLVEVRSEMWRKKALSPSATSGHVLHDYKACECVTCCAGGDLIDCVYDSLNYHSTASYLTRSALLLMPPTPCLTEVMIPNCRLWAILQ